MLVAVDVSAATEEGLAAEGTAMRRRHQPEQGNRDVRRSLRPPMTPHLWGRGEPSCTTTLLRLRGPSPGCLCAQTQLVIETPQGCLARKSGQRAGRMRGEKRTEVR